MSNTPVFDKLMAMPGARERYLMIPPRDHSIWFRHAVDKVQAAELARRRRRRRGAVGHPDGHRRQQERLDGGRRAGGARSPVI